MRFAHILAVAVAVAAHLTSLAQVQVKGYYRKDGTYVAPHTRSSSGSSQGGYSSSYVDPYQPAPTSGSVSAYSGSSQPTLRIPELRLSDGTVLRNVQVISMASAYAMARWDGGSGTIKFADLPAGSLQLLGREAVAEANAPDAAVEQVQAPSPVEAQAVAPARAQTGVAPSPSASVGPEPAAQPPQTYARAEAATPYVLGGIGALVVGIIIWLIIKNAAARAKEVQERADRCLRMARAFQEEVKQKRGLPAVAGSLLLKKGEVAFFSQSSKLYETRAVRYGSGGSVRVMKGVWLNSNRSESSQEWRLLDEGLLTVTNKRIVFDGGQTNRSIDLKKVLSIQPTLDAAEISVEGRQKSLIVTVGNGMIFATIAIICQQADDPQNIDPADLKFSYKIEA